MTETPIKDSLDAAEEVPEDLAATLATIEDRIERDKRTKEAAKKYGVSVGAIKEEIARRQKKATVVPIKTTAPSIEKLAELARGIIESKNVLAAFEQAWAKVAAGEAKNAKLLLLCGTSRLFSTCMNAAIKGPSSCGKSVLRGRVLDFFPPEAVISFTTLSEKALLYYREDFCHKILSMGEASGAEEQELQDYLLRELMSEGRLIYPVVQKVGEELVTVNIEKNGPVAFQVTTTKAALHPENETRMISIDVDDSQEQTELVIAKVAELVGLNAEGAKIDLEPWRDFQRWLAAGNCKVVVPFADALARLIPPKSVRLRRDFGQILLAIKAHALIHRAHRQIDDRDQIVADFADYVAVATLMGAIVSEASGTKISKAVQDTVDAVKQATKDMFKDDGASAEQVAKALKVDTSTAWRRLVVATKKGYVRNIETRKYQAGRYRATEHEIEIVDLLPTVDRLRGEEARGTPPELMQTCKRSTFVEKIQEVGVCSEHANGMQTRPKSEVVCKPFAYGNANDKALEDNDKSASFARLHSFSGGTATSSPSAQEETISEADRDPFDGLKDKDLIPELPSFLDRRKKHSSPASEPGTKVPEEVTLALLRGEPKNVDPFAKLAEDLKRR